MYEYLKQTIEKITIGKPKYKNGRDGLFKFQQKQKQNHEVKQPIHVVSMCSSE